MKFIAAGVSHREKLFMAANRVGKSELGCLELSYHLTGSYPDWWTGRRFDGPTRCWACGETSLTAKDILQLKLMGPAGEYGTGLIPKDNLIRWTAKRNVPDGLQEVFVKHATGGTSVLGFRSYDQGSSTFQGTAQHCILLDEEPPMNVYSECLVRTMTTNGIIMATFTPLLGLSDVVMYFLPEGRMIEESEVKGTGKFIIQCDWDQVPHLTQEAKKQLWESIPAYQREARSKGVPALGSGAIYPVSESEITVKPFEIPLHWPRVFGFDVGWNQTACVWAAWDRDEDIVYLYSEHYKGQAEPAIHAAAIRSRGDWIPGVIDPAARGRTQTDGTRLIDLYREHGLILSEAKNEVEAGLYSVWERLSTGRLKVFSTLNNWFMEFRIYRRDDKGKIVKYKDHLLDATRYLMMSGLDQATVRPSLFDDQDRYWADQSRNPYTGY